MASVRSPTGSGASATPACAVLSATATSTSSAALRLSATARSTASCCRSCSSRRTSRRRWWTWGRRTPGPGWPRSTTTARGASARLPASRAMSLRPRRGLDRRHRHGGSDMGAIHVHEFMTLDGVVDAPTWTFEYGFDPKMGDALAEMTGRSGGILLGRKTYEMFEPAWSTRTVEDDPGAPFFNDTTKHVVTGTLTEGTWRNSAIVGPYDPGAIRRLKDAVDGDLYVSGSITLVRAMLADGL